MLKHLAAVKLYVQNFYDFIRTIKSKRSMNVQ